MFEREFRREKNLETAKRNMAKAVPVDNTKELKKREAAQARL